MVSERSRKVAGALKPWLEEFYLPMTIYASFEEDPGKRWQVILAETLLDAQFGILCMTPGNLISPWILFEAGALSKTVSDRTSLCPYLYQLSVEELPEQLKQFGTCTADKEGTLRLLNAINNRLRENGEAYRTEIQLARQFATSWPDLEKKLDEIDARDVAGRISARIAEAQPRLWKTLDEFKGKNFFVQNVFYRSLLVKYLDDCRQTLTGSQAYFNAAWVLYPSYLIMLLELQPTIKAVAIVDAYEHFWRQKEGEIICNKTPKESTRVFVFDKPELLHANLDLLRHHAEKYNVYVLSQTSLANEHPDQSYDFSLIGSTEMTLLATYETIKQNGIPFKQIRFSAMASEISAHEKAMNDIIHGAFKIDPDGGWTMPSRSQGSGNNPPPRDTDIESLSDAVFRPQIQSLPRKQVEMSSYIDVIKYDRLWSAKNENDWPLMLGKVMKIHVEHGASR